MARFIVRVELHGADSNDYTKLHESMRIRGYNQSIQDTDLSWFYLPTAEYTINVNSSAANVRNDVMGIVQSVKPNFSLLVTEVADIAWYLAKQ